MRRVHDLGGAEGFGRIEIEDDEPVFHHEWERRTFALTVAVGFCGLWTLDKSRLARESLPQSSYLSFSYYHIWLAGLCGLLREVGVMGESEGRMGVHPPDAPSILRSDDALRRIYKGGSSLRSCSVSPLFSCGMRVRVKTDMPSRHTRLPRYICGHEGVVSALHGVHVFPDTNAVGAGENPQWLYNIRFTAAALWGDGAQGHESDDAVYVDCWESYLESV